MTPKTARSMTGHRALAVALALGCCLGAAGCGKKEASEQQAASAAKLLPRSISDDMPPYDTVKSKAPQATPEATDSGAPRAKRSDAADEAASAAEDAAGAAAEAAGAAAPGTTPAAE